jgi:hypothetical protein
LKFKLVEGAARPEGGMAAHIPKLAEKEPAPKSLKACTLN